jgi:3-oxoacyl-[acyl-carrier-protein] synthase-3
MSLARLSGIAAYLPEGVLDNPALAARFPEWPAERIEEKLGIRERRIAAADECASDLAVKAAEALFASTGVARGEVDYLLVCTQSPDYLLPTTACLVQDRLGLPKSVGALDFNLGCSGYVYGLGLAKGLVESGQARRVLLITSETYSKHLEADDKNVRTLFGDGAAASWVVADEAGGGGLGPFVYGTDGSGAENLIVRRGGMRCREIGDAFLRMDGPAIYSFTLRAVPAAVAALLAKAGLGPESVDLYVLHQASKYMLDGLQRVMKVPAEKMVFAMRETGNTVSASIPLALLAAEREGRLKPGMRVVLVGFGVGLSWGACLVEWP